jgi:hypothetical protein
MCGPNKSSAMLRLYLLVFIVPVVDGADLVRVVDVGPDLETMLNLRDAMNRLNGNELFHYAIFTTEI